MVQRAKTLAFIVFWFFVATSAGFAAANLLAGMGADLELAGGAGAIIGTAVLLLVDKPAT